MIAEYFIRHFAFRFPGMGGTFYPGSRIVTYLHDLHVIAPKVIELPVLEDDADPSLPKP